MFVRTGGHRVILLIQSISVFSQLQFIEKVSSKSVVKSSLCKFFLDEWNYLNYCLVFSFKRSHFALIS